MQVLTQLGRNLAFLVGDTQLHYAGIMLHGISQRLNARFGDGIARQLEYTQGLIHTQRVGQRRGTFVADLARGQIEMGDTCIWSLEQISQRQSANGTDTILRQTELGDARMATQCFHDQLDIRRTKSIIRQIDIRQRAIALQRSSQQLGTSTSNTISVAESGEIKQAGLGQ